MEPEFFEQLAMPLFDQLYNFAHWLTGAQADAEDLVQETYARALKGFSSFAAGTDLLGVDVPDTAQHVSDLEERAGGEADDLAG